MIVNLKRVFNTHLFKKFDGTFIVIYALIAVSCVSNCTVTATGNGNGGSTTGTVSTPTFSPAPGAFSANQSVSLTTATSGAVIYYTTDGTIPTTASSVYASPISVTGNGTTIITAYAVLSDQTDSALASGNYTVNIPVPCVSNPTHNSALTASTSSSVSHNAGLDCLSCHGGNGPAQTTWAAAGTMYSSVTGATIANAGNTITGVSSTNYTLTTDICGNFYATNVHIGTLKTGASNPTSSTHTMSASSFQTDTNGSCNKSGCHDGTNTSSWNSGRTRIF